MPTGTDLGQEPAIWWIENAWLLAMVLLVVLIISFVSRRWGSSFSRSIHRRDIFAFEPSNTTIGRPLAERFVSTVIRLFSNTQLVVGFILCGVLCFAMVLPQALAPFEPERTFDFFRLIGGELKAPPFSPDSKYLLGSDQKTRDLLSRIIHGTRETLTLCFAATILRMIIGGVLGWIAGWHKGRAGRFVFSISEVSGSIPGLLFAYIFVVSVGPQLGMGVFVLGLGLTGWAEITNLTNASVRRVIGQSYMEGALALGSDTSHLLRRHIWPNIAPQMVPAVALEVSAVLLLLAELGFLGLMVGIPAQDILFQTVRTTGDPEWAGMLAGTRVAIFYWPWLPIGPALAFLVAILGFNLLGTGLRDWLDPHQGRYL